MGWVLVLLLTISLGSVEAGSATVGKTASPPRQHIVEIRAFSFQPAQTTVSAGDTIVWINRDIVPHTVTATEGTWRSQAIEEGQSWEMKVGHDGMLSYFCEFHPHMTGTLAIR